MHTISLQRVSYSYTSAQTIFEDISLDLCRGWTGLVGANGVGKTTLLRLLSGELRPELGAIQLTPRDARVLLCEQTIEDRSPTLEVLSGAQDSDAYRLRGLLRLEPEGLARWLTLSPGERKRWQIGAALYESPEILLLDEPSNHLDGEGKQLLIDALQSFAGVGVLVSHDRELLRALTYQTVRCTPNEARLYPGDYTQAQLLWEAEELHKKEEYKHARQEEARRLRQLNAQREALRGAEKNQSAKSRMKNIKDHDARSMGTKFVIDAAAAKISRGVSVIKEKAEKASEARAEFHWRGEVGRSLFVAYELGGAERAELLDATRRLPKQKLGQVMSLLAALGVEPERVLSSQRVSPGEARKLALAFGLGSCAWALFLDEPTNHLDLPSIERLEEALADFPGALLLVSHDETFAKRCTQIQWKIQEKTLLSSSIPNSIN